jgi:hypothetical protein
LPVRRRACKRNSLLQYHRYACEARLPFGWFERVRDRDWFNADRRDEAEGWLTRCQGLLAEFEEEVYRRQGAGNTPERQEV